MQEKNKVNYSKKNWRRSSILLCMSVEQEQKKIHGIWIMAADCSSHMTGNQQFFVRMDENFSSEVKLGDGKFHEIKGKWVIALNSKGGHSKLIYDLLYVLGLTSNHLSVDLLLQKNYSVTFDGNESTTFNNDKNIIVAK